MSIEAKLNWTHGMQFVARSGKGPAIVIDDSESAGGPSPMELVLMGVAGCTAMDVVHILRKKRAPLTALEVTITGDRAEDYPKRYTRIRIEFVVTGSVRPPQVEHAIQLSMEKYCSAVASLNAEVEHTYRIIDPEAV